jgi:hypothetical protein
MSSLRDAILEKRGRQRRELEPNRQVVKGVLIAIDYTGKPDVAGRPGYVWVREYGANGGVFQALNTKVQKRVGLTVQLAVDPKAPFTRRVLGVDESILVSLDGYTGSPYLPNHHADHEWPDQAPGPDALQVYPRSIVPLRTQAGAGLTVDVAYLIYAYNGARKIFQGYTGFDISSHQPASGQALYVLVYLDPATNALGSTAGTATTDSPTVIPTLPAFTDNTEPSAFVRLDGDQTAITEADIVDARLFVSPVAGYSAANPTGTLGLAAVNGSAKTWMRSDAAPALDQGIKPLWSAAHVWTYNNPISWKDSLGATKEVLNLATGNITTLSGPDDIALTPAAGKNVCLTRETTAGFVKNAATTGALSGGQTIAAADLPAHDHTAANQGGDYPWADIAVYTAPTTWTPSFISTGATFAYTSQYGYYMQIGKLVVISLSITLSGNPGGTTSNEIRIQGLPVTPSAANGANRFPLTQGLFYAIGLGTGPTQLTALVLGGTDQIALRGAGNNVNNYTLLASDFAQNDRIDIGGVYIAA